MQCQFARRRENYFSHIELYACDIRLAGGHVYSDEPCWNRDSDDCTQPWKYRKINATFSRFTVGRLGTHQPAASGGRMAGFGGRDDAGPEWRVFALLLVECLGHFQLRPEPQQALLVDLLIHPGTDGCGCRPTNRSRQVLKQIADATRPSLSQAVVVFVVLFQPLLFYLQTIFAITDKVYGHTYRHVGMDR